MFGKSIEELLVKDIQHEQGFGIVRSSTDGIGDRRVGVILIGETENY
jgi:hypothetical protein